MLDSGASAPKATLTEPILPTETNERMQRMIVYGSVATPIKRPDSDHTHKWTVYVRGFHNEDLSTYIKKVIFRLHESFPIPSRCTAII